MHRTVDREAELEPDIPSDRRRAGRRDDASPTLIPLLQGNYPNEVHDPAAGDDDHNQLAAARGMVVWVLISAAVIVALLVWLILS